MAEENGLDIEDDLVNAMVKNSQPAAPVETPPVTPPTTPVAETPVVTPPVEVPADPNAPATLETPAPPAAEIPPTEIPAPVIDKNKILEEISKGSIKSEEDLNKFIEEYNKNKEVTESEEYQETLKLRAWRDKGYPAELFTPIQEMDTQTIDELSVEDTLKIKMKFENPEFTEEDINLMINQEYKQDADENKEVDIRAGKLRMQMAARGYKEQLRELKELAYVPTFENKQAEVQAAEEKRMSTWKSELPKLVTEFNEISIPLSDDGKDVFKWTLTKEQKTELQNELDRIVSNAPVQFDEQGIKALKNIMQEKFINKNINQISRAVAASVKSKLTEENIKKYNNPTGARPEATPPAPKVGKTNTELLREIADLEGVHITR